ncbi:hypothetical protein PCE1_004169 [Barthelona sp. PCE]
MMFFDTLKESKLSIFALCKWFATDKSLNLDSIEFSEVYSQPIWLQVLYTTALYHGKHFGRLAEFILNCRGRIFFYVSRFLHKPRFLLFCLKNIDIFTAFISSNAWNYRFINRCQANRNVKAKALFRDNCVKIQSEIHLDNPLTLPYDDETLFLYLYHFLVVSPNPSVTINIGLKDQKLAPVLLRVLKKMLDEQTPEAIRERIKRWNRVPYIFYKMILSDWDLTTRLLTALHPQRGVAKNKFIDCVNLIHWHIRKESFIENFYGYILRTDPTLFIDSFVDVGDASNWFYAPFQSMLQTYAPHRVKDLYEGYAIRAIENGYNLNDLCDDYCAFLYGFDCGHAPDECFYRKSLFKAVLDECIKQTKDTEKDYAYFNSKIIPILNQAFGFREFFDIQHEAAVSVFESMKDRGFAYDQEMTFVLKTIRVICSYNEDKARCEEVDFSCFPGCEKVMVTQAEKLLFECCLGAYGDGFAASAINAYVRFALYSCDTEVWHRCKAAMKFCTTTVSNWNMESSVLNANWSFWGRDVFFDRDMQSKHPFVMELPKFVFETARLLDEVKGDDFHTTYNQIPIVIFAQSRDEDYPIDFVVEFISEYWSELSKYVMFRRQTNASYKLLTHAHADGRPFRTAFGVRMSDLKRGRTLNAKLWGQDFKLHLMMKYERYTKTTMDLTLMKRIFDTVFPNLLNMAYEMYQTPMEFDKFKIIFQDIGCRILKCLNLTQSSLYLDENGEIKQDYFDLQIIQQIDQRILKIFVDSEYIGDLNVKALLETPTRQYSPVYPLKKDIPKKLPDMSSKPDNEYLWPIALDSQPFYFVLPYSMKRSKVIEQIEEMVAEVIRAEELTVSNVDEQTKLFKRLFTYRSSLSNMRALVPKLVELLPNLESNNVGMKRIGRYISHVLLSNMHIADCKDEVIKACKYHKFVGIAKPYFLSYLLQMSGEERQAYVSHFSETINEFCDAVVFWLLDVSKSFSIDIDHSKFLDRISPAVATRLTFNTLCSNQTPEALANFTRAFTNSPDIALLDEAVKTLDLGVVLFDMVIPSLFTSKNNSYIVKAYGIYDEHTNAKGVCYEFPLPENWMRVFDHMRISPLSSVCLLLNIAVVHYDTISVELETALRAILEPFSKAHSDFLATGAHDPIDADLVRAVSTWAQIFNCRVISGYNYYPKVASLVSNFVQMYEQLWSVLPTMPRVSYLTAEILNTCVSSQNLDALDDIYERGIMCGYSLDEFVLSMSSVPVPTNILLDKIQTAINEKKYNLATIFVALGVYYIPQDILSNPIVFDLLTLNSISQYVFTLREWMTLLVRNEIIKLKVPEFIYVVMHCDVKKLMPPPVEETPNSADE